MDLVRRDAAGDVKREQLGEQIFELMRCHGPGGVGPRRIGVILHVGRTLFVHLLASARADNLEAETDDRRGNAATDILSEVVRQAFAAGRAYDPTYRPQVHAREHERIVRDERHGTALKETFIACHVIAFTQAGSTGHGRGQWTPSSGSRSLVSAPLRCRPRKTGTAAGC